TAPDFEAPGSADNSNVYEVEVTVSDGTNTAMQTITITVTNDPSDDILSFSEAEEAAVIFPNPSGRYLEVRSSFGGTFQLLSLSGKPLLKGPTNTQMDIASLHSGLYLVQLPDGRLLKFVRE
ncbi:MAG: T9SS type A sorting domain-containing protein, partial [Ekhidna sp.]|nr:T9SS type A sorting domain-containing protein [Ekhidna sp.]